MLRASHLSMTYRTFQVETTALDDIDLTIEPGEFIVLKGPSGCGKSTLLNILGLLDVPSRGTLEFHGRDVTRLPEHQRTHLRRGKIGYVFQGFHLINDLSVAENVELPLLYLKVPKCERLDLIRVALHRVGLAHRMEHYPYQLSGGQQQRAAVARAIVTSPSLILADEPTGNLDSKNGAEVMSLLAELNQSGSTIVMATHSAADARFGSRILRIYDGRFLDNEETAPGELPVPLAYASVPGEI